MGSDRVYGSGHMFQNLSLLGCLFALVLFCSGCSASAVPEEEPASCACNCWTCVTASADRLFSLTEDDILHDILYLSDGDKRVYLEGGDLSSALGLLNSFQPVRQEEAGAAEGEGCYLFLSLLDSDREFWITRDSISIGDTRYVGEEDCLGGLLDAFLEGKPLEAPATKEPEPAAPQNAEENPENACPCGCQSCGCAPFGRLFAYPRDRVISVWADDGGGRIVLEGDRARACVDILNDFQPQKAEKVPEMVSGGGYGLILLLPDSDRRFTVFPDSVLIGDVLYSGEEGCMDELITFLGRTASAER